MEKGMELTRMLGDNYIQYLRYYASLDRKYTSSINREINQAYAVIQQLKNLSRKYKVTEMDDYIDPIIEEAESYYTTLVGNTQQRGQ
jgi:hypothetical protein